MTGDVPVGHLAVRWKRSALVRPVVKTVLYPQEGTLGMADRWTVS